MKRLIVLCVMVLFLGMEGSAQEAEKVRPSGELALTNGGKTEYVVVTLDNPGDVDAFAIKELTSALMEASGADFKSVPYTDAAKYAKRIFVGVGPSGTNCELDAMQDQDSVCESSAADVYLYGKGIHGNLYAVYDFLEGSIGCRWFSAFAKPYIPKHEQLRLAPFKKMTRLDFKFRSQWAESFYNAPRPEAPLFLYRNKLNMGMDEKLPKTSGVVDEMKVIQPATHSLSCYMPPREIALPGFNPPLKSLKNKNYFTTNPEFFSLDATGKRVETLQVCFSNKALRKELTANIEANIQAQGGKVIVDITQNDHAGHFCYCADCAKLEEKLGCNGGPLYDYIIELCCYLKDKYPDVTVRTYAYNVGQGQEPPKKVDKLPDNLLVFFAPVSGNWSQDWNHPSNIKDRQDLEGWSRICRNVWVWYYVGFEDYVPFCNTQRLVSDMRLMKKLGVQGLFNQYANIYQYELGFTELQSYMMLKLSQNVSQETDLLISGFMNFQYGKAATVMRQYHDYLEKCRNEKDMGYVGSDYSISMFPYLTAANLLRWEQSFDEMEQLTKDDPARLFNVRMTRCPLDLVVLDKWENVKKKYPDYFKDAKVFENRVRSTYDRVLKTHVSNERAQRSVNYMKRAYAKLDAKIANLASEAIVELEPPGGKAIPAQFAGILKEKIRRVIPTNADSKQYKNVSDPDAAFGVATKSVPMNPFPMGFYDSYGRKHGVQRSVQLSEIKAGGYQIYKLGSVKLTVACGVWIADWQARADLKQFYDESGNNQWDVYVSLKFEGPMYTGNTNATENRAFIDQVILIKVDNVKNKDIKEVATDLPSNLDAKIIELKNKCERISGSYLFNEIPDALENAAIVIVKRGDGAKPGCGYSLKLTGKSTVYLFVANTGIPVIPDKWVLTALKDKWGTFDATDKIYKYDASEGVLEIPPHDGFNGTSFGVPNACVIVPTAQTK